MVYGAHYFGRTVNIAARIADYARSHEVLVSDTARQTSGLDEVEVELIGDVPLSTASARPGDSHKATRAE